MCRLWLPVVDGNSSPGLQLLPAAHAALDRQQVVSLTALLAKHTVCAGITLARVILPRAPTLGLCASRCLPKFWPPAAGIEYLVVWVARAQWACVQPVSGASS